MTSDPTLQIIQQWTALEAERESLHTAWGDHETWLVHRYDWLNLTAEQQRAIPEAKRFDEIDRRFEEIGNEQAALFDALPENPATDTTIVIASLSLAATILLPEDYPGVHGLITRAVRDLKLLAAVP
ncbi:hypothetical protein [Caulobacter segnis]